MKEFYRVYAVDNYNMALVSSPDFLGTNLISWEDWEKITSSKEDSSEVTYQILCTLLPTDEGLKDELLLYRPVLWAYMEGIIGWSGEPLPVSYTKECHESFVGSYRPGDFGKFLVKDLCDSLSADYEALPGWLRLSIDYEEIENRVTRNESYSYVEHPNNSTRYWFSH